MDRSAEKWLDSAEFLFVNSKTGTSVEEINTLTQGALAAAMIGLPPL